MATRMAEHMSENMGSLLAGVIASAVLLGVSLVQTFYYYTTYHDKWYLKTLVAVTAVLDTAHQIMISHTMWHYLIKNFNKPQNLEFVIWSVIMEALCTGVTGAGVQLFYVVRIWRLSKRNKLLTGSILFLTLISAAMGTAWVIVSMQQRTFDDLLTVSWLTITVDSLSAVTDVVIAASLVLTLHQARTGFKKSDNTINTLIVFVVNTGVLTSCCALVSLLILIASPLTLIYAPLYFCLGRLYTNSLLATLNARDLVKQRLVDKGSHMLVSIPRDHPDERSHQVHNLDSKLESDDDLTQIHDTLPRSITKERESKEYGSGYPVQR
ncbi:hypothetical protein LshimejAT787_1202370 [Lyophyllum shimeji]|uniref:DUF6534 domain-containing protein n=1 Tax=Lyophyllum shimeji TaxID=47721 RepID=A0A9P3URL7_LYOSH|nr:hypothetical protein LshimejAT787_1202370 [Lyophyllum shimeji]